jgi:hypothetical protein
MSADADRTNEDETHPIRTPWRILFMGVLCALAGLLIGAVHFGDWSVPIRFVVLAVGVLSAGIAVAINPRSALVLLGAAFVALVASFAGPPDEWDSARLVLRVMAVVAGVCAVLVLLPTGVRRAVISLLILIHFGGIITAVASASESWLAKQVWIYFYRPYLNLMYLNNAYHFYSPEPGPAQLLWFCIEYEKDEGDPEGTRYLRWVKVPNMDSKGNHLRADGTPLSLNIEYTRRLSLAQHTDFPGPPIAPINLLNLATARDMEAAEKGIPSLQQTVEALGLAGEAQYREPNDVAKKWLQMYARHVAHNYPHQDKPWLEVKGVKIYKVIHNIMLPGMIAKGMQPDEPTRYHPYYMGEFDKDGQMKQPLNALNLIVYRSRDGKEYTEKRDRLLYWLIPIMRTPDDTSKRFRVPVPHQLKNYVLVHAGDVPGGELP